MSEVNEVAILKRAKELCEQDGFASELNFVTPSARYAPIKPQPYLSDERRQQYIACARAELRKENDNA